MIARRSWRALHRDLDQRGLRRRESGAFLLGDRSTGRVRGWALFDDLDPDCLVGGIALHAIAFSRLWELCHRHRLSVVADLHTHPGAAVDQSRVDAANPMIRQAGHIALITPHYARRTPHPHQVGVHLYLGDRRWRTVPPADRADVLSLPRLARTARRLRAPQPPGIDIDTETGGRP